MKKNKLYLIALTSILYLTGCNSNVSESISSSSDNTSEESSSSIDTSLSESTESVSEKTEVVPESLKILSIGNSFALDTNEHIPNIALSLGVKEIKVATLYIGGCSINKHYDNAINNKSNYEYYVNTGDGWTTTYNKSILYALQSDEWDYISIQHGTGDGSRYANLDSYVNLENLISYVKENAIGDPKIAFNMTWVGEKGSHEELINVYDNNTLYYYASIVELTRDYISETKGLDIISPTGTAIQNARTAKLTSLTRDNYHLSLSTGRFIAGLTFFKALTSVDFSNITWHPESMSQYMIDVAIESANNAIDNPYVLTNSTIEVPPFEWPTNVTYGQAATPDNPYYEHAARQAPEVAEKIDLLEYFGLSDYVPTIQSTFQTPNNLNLSIDIAKTPYLYYSFVIPKGSDFTFSIYSDTRYAPWLSFLDVTKGNAKLGYGAETWDALYNNKRAQYATVSQTGCIDLREYLTTDTQKWIISMMKLYAPKGDGVIVSYFFIGS